MILVTAVFYILVAVVAHVWIRAQGRGWIFAEDLNDGLPVALGLGVSAAILVVASGLLLRRHLRMARDLEGAFREILGNRRGLEVAILAICSGAAEEALFRGAMQPQLGLVITSLVFGGIHFIPKRVFLPWTVFAVVVGFLLGSIYEASDRNIYAPVAAHVLINGLNLWRICGPGAPQATPSAPPWEPPREPSPDGSGSSGPPP